MVGVRGRYTDERGRWRKTEAEEGEVGRGRGEGKKTVEEVKWLSGMWQGQG